MLFVVVMTLSSAWGFGLGMAIVIWRMASEPCCIQTRKPRLHQAVGRGAQDRAAIRDLSIAS